jgi:hypothetical protein
MEKAMPEPPAPHRPGEPPSQPPIKGRPERPARERVEVSDRDPETPMRDALRPAAPPKSAGRRWDRYDYIGAAIVGILVALWVVHFSLPTLPPDNVPDVNLPAGRN